MTTEQQAEEKVEEVKEQIEETKEKLADPGTSDAEKAKLEERLNSLDSRMDKLIDSLDKLANRPFAPAPAAKGKTEEKAPEVKEDKPKERQHRFGSTRWFGDRAYED